jgi:hypothetical protein
MNVPWWQGMTRPWIAVFLRLRRNADKFNGDARTASVSTVDRRPYLPRYINTLRCKQ